MNATSWEEHKEVEDLLIYGFIVRSNSTCDSLETKTNEYVSLITLLLSDRTHFIEHLLSLFGHLSYLGRNVRKKTQVNPMGLSSTTFLQYHTRL